MRSGSKKNKVLSRGGNFLLLANFVSLCSYSVARPHSLAFQVGAKKACSKSETIGMSLFMLTPSFAPNFLPLLLLPHPSAWCLLAISPSAASFSDAPYLTNLPSD